MAKNKYHSFMLKNRDKGIPNLMLYVGIGNIIVYLFTIFGNADMLYNLLCFDAEKILHGQIWRCVSYIFTYGFGYTGGAISFFLLLISVYFYHWLCKTLESAWGTLRMNIYYCRGVLLTSLVPLLLYLVLDMVLPIYVTPYYLNLSLFLAVATLAPDHQVLIFFVIPIKMRWLALVDIALIIYDMIGYVQQFSVFAIPTWQILLSFGLAPLISLINFGITFGKNALNLLPGVNFSGSKRRREFKRKVDAEPNPDWAKNYRNASGERPYRHKCTVCGRTDTQCPGLEFRYCSRCKGYFCYCIDHINHHTHVE
ncbi:MAG: hypothetical protein E7434_06345 [Ruminococcaceae bacterium]|nr:hypothetical protein [Oscillospiraceae bacterium]